MASWVMPAYDLKRQVRRALRTIETFSGDEVNVDERVSLPALKMATALVFMQEVRAGFMWSGSFAAGFIVVKLADGKWSAPSSIGAVGVGFGFAVGAQTSDIVLALYDQSGIDTFRSSGHLKLGGDLSVTAGPLGRSATVDGRLSTSGITGCFSWSRSHGLFAGVSLQGAILVRRDADNKSLYGSAVTIDDLLSGRVEPPADAVELHGKIDTLLRDVEPAEFNIVKPLPASDGEAEADAPPAPPPVEPPADAVELHGKIDTLLRDVEPAEFNIVKPLPASDGEAEADAPPAPPPEHWLEPDTVPAVV